jgi:hypothetical protein
MQGLNKLALVKRLFPDRPTRRSDVLAFYGRCRRSAIRILIHIKEMKALLHNA